MNQAPDPQKEALKDQWAFNFAHHNPTPNAIRKMNGMRSAAKAMADAVIDMTPAGRDQAIALTHLEQMLFHANAAIARSENTDNNETPEEDKHLEPAPATPRKG